jgi:hypothetical protein
VFSNKDKNQILEAAKLESMNIEDNLEASV